MDIYDSDSSARHDITTAVDDISRHLQEYAADDAKPVAADTADAGQDADEEDPPVIEDDEDKHWGFIMDWGPY